MFIDGWIDKENVGGVYVMDYYSAVKKNEMMAFATTWMDLQIIILSEVSQTEQDKYHEILLICRVLEMIQINLFTKVKQNHWLREQIYGSWGNGGMVGGIDREFGVDMYMLLYLK